MKCDSDEEDGEGGASAYGDCQADEYAVEQDAGFEHEALEDESLFFGCTLRALRVVVRTLLVCPRDLAVVLVWSPVGVGIRAYEIVLVFAVIRRRSSRQWRLVVVCCRV